MNLVFAIKALKDAHGGAERVLADITAGLAKRGHDITIVSFDPKGAKPFYPLHKDVDHICLDIGDVHKKTNMSEAISRIRTLRKTVKDISPDICIAFMHSMFIPASVALMGTNIPLIASEHIVPDHYKSRPLEFMLLTLSSLLIDRYTVLSGRIAQSYPALIQKKMTAIPNPVHEAKKQADVLARTKTQKTILNVGRLDLQKDQKTLINAFAQLADDYPDWILKIIGEGPLRPALEQQIEALGLSSRIVLPGVTKDIEAEYMSAQIFALSSRYESFGLVTAEAMAHGLPCVGFSECPGTNELIQDKENGLLAQGLSDPQEFAKVLKVLIEDADLREKIGMAGKQSIKKFSLDGVVLQWENLLHQVVGDKR